MTNEEQKLREIAYKHAEPKVIWNDGNMSIYPDEEKIESLLSDLTALISEHYYPKEFVIWLLNGYTFLKRDQSFVVNYPYLNEHNNYRHFTCDELFSYWKENER
jgi:hypothetical protein